MESIQEQDVQRIPSTAYAPSSMKCARNMFYKRSGYETDPTPREHHMIGITESGTDRHDRLQHQIAQSTKIKWVDVEKYIEENNLDHLEIRDREGLELQLFDKERHLSFRCDGIIEFMDEFFILEIKTETSTKWDRRKEVDPDHYDQATVYSIAFGIPKVMFLYENRDRCLKKAYVFEPTEEQKDIILKRIQIAEQAFALNKEPIAEPSSSNCRYCRYKIYCDEAK